MKYKIYNSKEVLKDDNLLLDIKRDIIFKNCFLDIKSKPYLILLINMLFNINYDDLKKYFIIKNSELPSRKIDKKSSYSDLICSYKNIDFILEMNYRRDNDIYEKNIDYLFKQHTGKISKENRYGKDIYTYLINIDNYDFLHENELIYVSGLNYLEYKISKYKNIKIIHINLAYLRKKLYNKSELNELEKLLIIFVCQEKNIIRNIIKSKEIEGVIEIMERMKYENDYIATYNREEFELYLKERDAKLRQRDAKLRQRDAKIRQKDAKEREITNKLKQETKIMQEETKIMLEKAMQDELKNKLEKILIDKSKKEFNQEKKSIVQEFKKLGLSLKRISEITKLPIEQIKMLL